MTPRLQVSQYRGPLTYACSRQGLAKSHALVSMYAVAVVYTFSRSCQTRIIAHTGSLEQAVYHMPKPLVAFKYAVSGSKCDATYSISWQYRKLHLCLRWGLTRCCMELTVYSTGWNTQGVHKRHGPGNDTPA
jgi:hypothetical protein